MANITSLEKVRIIEKNLRKHISADLKQQNSLIISHLLESFALLEKKYQSKDIDLKAVIPFMTIHTKNINKENARDVLMKALKNKLSNLGYRKGSSLTIHELLEFSSILDIQPETLFPNYQVSKLFPVEYCSINQVEGWISEAKKKNSFDSPIHIPFQNAPIIDVSLDIFISASKNNTLETMINACYPAEIGSPSFDKNTMHPAENYIQMQIFLSRRTNRKDKVFSHSVAPLLKNKTISKSEVKQVLTSARKEYATACKDQYNNERKYIESLLQFKDDGVLCQYYSEHFEKAFNNKLDQLINAEKSDKKNRTWCFKLDDMIELAKKSANHTH